MIRSALAAFLLIATALAATSANAADPITVATIYGYITSPIPAAQVYQEIPPQTDHGLGVPELWVMIQYRAGAPTLNVASVVPHSELAKGVGNLIVNNGSLAIAYDANANTTTVTIQAGDSSAQMVVPKDLSGLTAKLDGSPQTYSFKDANGKSLLTAVQSTTGLTSVEIPGAVSAAPRLAPPVNATLPPNCGSGTFTKVKNGQTLTGTFQPASFEVWTYDSSLDAYWRTH